MGRELRRLLIDPDRLLVALEAPGQLALQPAEHHYLARVLRLRPGDPVALIDGLGGLWQAALAAGPWLEHLQALDRAAAPPTPALTLALALPRREVELVWRMATELGIDRLQPLRGQRSPGECRPAPERWQAVLREACEQCERLWLPSLEPLQEALLWLGSPAPALRLLATTRRPGLPLLERALAQADSEPDHSGGVVLAVGPEGGWSPAEEERAIAAGWRAVSLGDTILRCPTAAVVAAARLCAWRQGRRGKAADRG